MEWVLQLADELDDLVATMRHGWLAFRTEFGAVLLSAGGLGAMLAALALGAQSLAIEVAALILSVAGLLKIRGARARFLA